jgi:hypothetical protein
VKSKLKVKLGGVKDEEVLPRAKKCQQTFEGRG